MRIGIDIDGTITRKPEFFAFLTKALLLCGHEVHVITYRELALYGYTRAQLKEWGIQYTSLRLSDQFLTAAEWKSKVGRDLELDVMIDDDIDVLGAIDSKVLRLCPMI